MPAPCEFVRAEVQRRLIQWRDIRAVLEGEDEVKKLREHVLPRPNAADESKENCARFESYLARAVLYNVTSRTLRGMVGFVFKKPPVVKLPAALSVLEKNVDGAGVTLLEQSKTALARALSYGRTGLLVDYPRTGGNVVSVAEMERGNIRPTIVLYEPEQIINWRHRVVGSTSVLELLVLKEHNVDIAVNEFETRTQCQYRVLTLTPAGVQVQIFKPNPNYGKTLKKSDKANTTDEYIEDTGLRSIMLGKDGKPIEKIPFIFIGSENNDSNVDVPPLLDLVRLNLAHFRNSADYEEACFLVGQPTPYVTGLTQTWVDEVLKGTMNLGSRAVIPIPAGGTAGLLQAAPNMLPKEAMELKEKQMVSLGARLVEQRTVRQTATESILNHTSETSTLTSAANSVFLAYQQALEFCALFVDGGKGEIQFELGEELSHEVLEPQAVLALVALWQSGLQTDEEARETLMSAGLAWDKTFKPVDKKAALEKAKAQVKKVPPPPPGR